MSELPDTSGKPGLEQITNISQGSDQFGDVIYLDRTSYTVLASALPLMSGYAIFKPYTYPATINPGDSGVLTTGTLYSVFEEGQTVGTAKLSYTVTAGSGSNLLVDFIFDYYNTNGTNIYEAQTTYQVDPSGTPILSKMVRTCNDLALTFMTINYSYTYTF